MSSNHVSHRSGNIAVSCFPGVHVSLFSEKSFMRSFARLALAAFAVAVVATTSQAAVLNFTGKIIGGDDPPFLVNGNFNLSATYNENATQSSGDATASTISFQATGGGSLNYTKPGVRLVSLTFGKSGTNDTLRIAGDYRPVGGGNLANLDLTFTRTNTTTTTLSLTAANIATMLSAFTTYTGNFRQFDNNDAVVATAVLGGTIPVPEPGSIGLLAGLGLVCGRRVWRRRQQKQAAAV